MSANVMQTDKFYLQSAETLLDSDREKREGSIDQVSTAICSDYLPSSDRARYDRKA
jgi:hypothetical protein